MIDLLAEYSLFIALAGIIVYFFLKVSSERSTENLESLNRLAYENEKLEIKIVSSRFEQLKKDLEHLKNRYEWIESKKNTQEWYSNLIKDLDEVIYGEFTKKFNRYRWIPLKNISNKESLGPNDVVNGKVKLTSFDMIEFKSQSRRREDHIEKLIKNFQFILENVNERDIEKVEHELILVSKDVQESILRQDENLLNYKKVKSITFENKNFSDSEFTEGIEYLSELNSISLKNCEIYFPHLDDFKKVKNLKSLNISNTKVDRVFNEIEDQTTVFNNLNILRIDSKSFDFNAFIKFSPNLKHIIILNVKLQEVKKIISYLDSLERKFTGYLLLKSDKIIDQDYLDELFDNPSLHRPWLKYYCLTEKIIPMYKDDEKYTLLRPLPF